MRSIIKQIALLERVDQLIRLRATGRPKQLAERLEVSEATVYRVVDAMKELNAPIYYDLSRQSYVYSQSAKFQCGFFVKELDQEFQKNISGGSSFNNFRMIMNF